MAVGVTVGMAVRAGVAVLFGWGEPVGSRAKAAIGGGWSGAAVARGRGWVWGRGGPAESVGAWEARGGVGRAEPAARVQRARVAIVAVAVCRAEAVAGVGAGGGGNSWTRGGWVEAVAGGTEAGVGIGRTAVGESVGDRGNSRGRQRWIGAAGRRRDGRGRAEA